MEERFSLNAEEQPEKKNLEMPLWKKKLIIGSVIAMFVIIILVIIIIAVNTSDDETKPSDDGTKPSDDKTKPDSDEEPLAEIVCIYTVEDISINTTLLGDEYNKKDNIFDIYIEKTKIDYTKKYLFLF